MTVVFDYDCGFKRLRGRRLAFTLIELLVSIAVIGLLVSMLIPALSSARRQARSTICKTRLRTAGHGLMLYANDHKGVLTPGRLPKIDDNRWRIRVVGGVKYRPTFLTMMESQIGLRPFTDPKPSRTEVDVEGQPGDRQNYSSEQYLCPEVSEWVDERNGAYGYNYQFLGNSRLRNSNALTSYKNWPVLMSRVRTPAKCLAVADCIGTAASFSRFERSDYEDNEFGQSKTGRSLHALGNEGFNLDPPRVDPNRGEMASLKDGHAARTAVDERHGGKATALWLDGHASSETLKSLGYQTDEKTGIVGFEGNNRFFHIESKDEAWEQ